MKHSVQIVPRIGEHKAEFRDASALRELFSDSKVDLNDPARPFVHPKSLSDEEQRRILAGIDDGSILAVRFAAKVFGDQPNMNLIRPRPELTHEVADAAPGVPLMHDHESYNTAARAGDVLDSKFVQLEGQPSEVIDLGEIREPETMRRFVRGLLDEFSITFTHREAMCSFCETPVELFWDAWPMLSCDCKLGTVQKREDGTEQLVEMWTTSNSRKELSFVNFGAYPDTELRASFERRAIAAQQAQTRREGIMPEKTQAAPCAPDETAAVGNGSATANHDGELAALRAQLAAAQAATKAANEAAFNTIFADGVKSLKFGPAQKEAMKAVFSSHCEGNPAAFLEFVDTLPANPAYSATATGVASTEPVSHSAPVEADPLELINRGVEFGIATSANLDKLREKLSRMRFTD